MQDLEFLELSERVTLATKVGESQFREFKSAFEGAPGKKVPRSIRSISEDVGRTLVAFANADGGELLVGVEDDGSVTGIPFDETKVADLMAAPHSHVHADTPLPPPRVAVVNVAGASVAYFAVAKGTGHIHLTSDGRCVKRVDRDSVPVSPQSISAHRIEDESRHWDRQFVPGATLSDIDLDLVGSVAGQIAYGISPEKCLQYLDLAEFTPDGLRLKNAALALFSKEIRRWLPRCQVRIMWVKGKERLSGEAFNIEREDMVSDNILALVDKAWERLTVALSQSTVLTSEARFEQTLLYPQIACREALINAIVHRNYAIEGRGIELSIFSDRLEIESPGMLLSTVSIEELRSQSGVHESRNPLIARVLREVGLVREMGEGVRRIFEVMKSNALAEPTFETSTASFSVSLSNRSLYPSEVKLWLSNFDLNELTEAQRGVLALGYGGRAFSTQEIIDRLGIVDTDQVREVTQPLRQAGLIERTADHKQLIREARERRVPKRDIPSYRVVDAAGRRPPSPTGGAPSIALTVDSGEDDPELPVDSVEVYLGNLPFDLDKAGLVEFLSAAECDLLSLTIPRPNIRGRKNRGYAFATLSLGGRSADQLIGLLDGGRISGRRVLAQSPGRKSTADG